MKYSDFKAIIVESSDGVENAYHREISIHEVIDILKNKCKKYNKKKPIYRGIRGKSKSLYGVVEGQKGGRKSENTSNYYTVIFDKLIGEKNKSYPLRSKSIICSTNKEYAEHYGEVYNIIPLDDVIVGVVPSEDIWDIEISDGYHVSDVNDLMRSKGISDNSYDSIINGLKKLSESDYKPFIKIFGSQDSVEDSIRKLYDVNFGFYTHDKIKGASNNELWIGGKCLVIKSIIYDTIIDNFDKLVSGDYELMIDLDIGGHQYVTPNDYFDRGKGVLIHKDYIPKHTLNYDRYDAVTRDEFFGKVLKKYVKPSEVDDYNDYINSDDFTDIVNMSKATVVTYLNLIPQAHLNMMLDVGGFKMKYDNERKDIDMIVSFYKIDGIKK